MPDTQTRVITLTPVITTDAYTAGDALGGLLKFENVLFNPKRTGVALSLTIIDKASQDAETELVLFSETFTATADNAAFAPSDADLLNCLGTISVGAGNYATFSANSAGTKPNAGLGLHSTEDYRENEASSIYGQLVTRGTPTYAVGDIQIKLTVLQD